MRHRNIAFFVPHIGCPHRCSFCDQRAITGRQRAPSPQEVDETLRQVCFTEHTETEIAFFGGSFTAIDRREMAALLKTASRYVGRGGARGIRISTRPDYVDEGILSLLRQYGVTIVELGAQSMRDTVLMCNQRGHTAQQVREASRLISSAGLSLGLQMMTGLYGDDDEGAWETARELAALHPDTMRIYPTVVLEGTQLAQLTRQGSYAASGVEATVSLCSGMLSFFTLHKIPVIRLGLHDEPGLKSRVVGGAYHPALRELCEGELMLTHARDALRGKAAGDYTLWVRPCDISRMVGQKKRNLAALGNEGYAVSIRTDEAIAPFGVELREH